jgi:hypothetical protein
MKHIGVAADVAGVAWFFGWASRTLSQIHEGDKEEGTAQVECLQAKGRSSGPMPTLNPTTEPGLRCCCLLVQTLVLRTARLDR